MKIFTCKLGGKLKKVDNNKSAKNYCSLNCRWDVDENGIYLHNSGYYKYAKGGFVHRVKMENELGRKLKKGERVLHVNGDKLDNSLENLKLIGIGQSKRALKKLNRPDHETRGRKKKYPEGCREAARLKREAARKERLEREAAKTQPTDRDLFMKRLKKNEAARKYRMKKNPKLAEKREEEQRVWAKPLPLFGVPKP